MISCQLEHSIDKKTWFEISINENTKYFKYNQSNRDFYQSILHRVQKNMNSESRDPDSNKIILQLMTNNIGNGNRSQRMPQQGQLQLQEMMKSVNTDRTIYQNFQKDQKAEELCKDFYNQDQYKMNKVYIISNFQDQVFDILLRLKKQIKCLRQGLKNPIKLKNCSEQNQNNVYDRLIFTHETRNLAKRYQFLWKILPKEQRENLKRKFKIQQKVQQKEKQKQKQKNKGNGNIQQMMKNFFDKFQTIAGNIKTNNGQKQIKKNLIQPQLGLQNKDQNQDDDNEHNQDQQQNQEQNYEQDQDDDLKEPQQQHMFTGKRLQYAECLQSLYYSEGVQQYQNQILEIKDFIQKIFKGIRHTVYLPTMLKVTLAGINSVDKSKGIAEIAVRAEIKVNIPGYSNSPQFYKNLFRKMKIKFKTEDLSKLHDTIVDFSLQEQYNKDLKSNIVAKYIQAQTYFDIYYNWDNYKIPGSKVVNKVENFQGFILLAQVKNLTVKLEWQDFRSPIQLLDIKGIVVIQPLKISYQKLSRNLQKKDDPASQLLRRSNPQIVFKFNLISLYSEKRTDISPLYLFNHISTFGQLSKEDYNLAPNFMLLQITNSKYSQMQLKSNVPCMNRWKNKRNQKKHKKINNEQQGDFSKQTVISANYNSNTKLMASIEKYLRDLSKSKNSLNGQKLLKNIEFFKRLFNKLSFQNENMLIQQIQSRIKIFQAMQYYIRKLIIFLNQNLTIKNSQQLKMKYDQILIKLQQKQHQLIQKLELQIIKCENKIDIYTQKLYQTTSRDQQLQKLTNNRSFKNQKIQKYQDLNKKCKDTKNSIQSFLDKQSQQQQIQQHPTDYQHNISKAHFHFPVYRDPGTALLNVYILTNVLGIFNLLIFFQQNNFSERLASLVTLLIAFAGMIIVLQQNIITKSPSITQILFYLIMISLVLCLIHSFYLDITKQDSEPLKNVIFWICAGIQAVNFFTPIAMYLIHVFFQEPRYTKNYQKLLKIFQQIYLVMPGSQELDEFLQVYQQVDRIEQKYARNQKKDLTHQTHQAQRQISNMQMLNPQNKFMSQAAPQGGFKEQQSKKQQKQSILERIQQNLLIDLIQLYQDSSLRRMLQKIKSQGFKLSSKQEIQKNIQKLKDQSINSKKKKQKKNRIKRK